MQEDVAAVAVRERDKDPANQRFVLHIVAMRVHDADHFEVVRRAVARRLRVAQVLTDRVVVREKFLGHFLVDDGDARRILVFRLRLGEIAAAQRRTPMASK